MPCPYCSTPMTGRKVNHCGAVDCQRTWQRNRSRVYMSQRAAEGKPRYSTAPLRPCVMCGKGFRPDRGRDRTYCSRTCASLWRYDGLQGWQQSRHPFTPSQLRRRKLERLQAKSAAGSKGTTPWVAGACIECGASFVKQNSMTTFCTRACAVHARRARRRARQHGMKVTRVRRRRIYERDNWTCYLCGYPVDRTATAPALDAPVLDHVIALAAGGDHSEANLATAHFYCNSFKRDLPFEMVA